MSLSPPADATPLKSSEHQLACDVVVLYDCHESIILHVSEICHVTQIALWTTKTPDMTCLNIFNQHFQLEACVIQSNGARKRYELGNNAGMMVNDAEKRDVVACFPIIIL